MSFPTVLPTYLLPIYTYLPTYLPTCLPACLPACLPTYLPAYRSHLRQPTSCMSRHTHICIYVHAWNSPDTVHLSVQFLSCARGWHSKGSEIGERTGDAGLWTPNTSICSSLSLSRSMIFRALSFLLFFHVEPLSRSPPARPWSSAARNM